MMQGQNDARILDRFVHDFSSRFAEENGTLHGAYGWRWTQAYSLNQIFHVIKILQDDPNSRQAVIQMWDAPLDLRAKVKDKPCNTHLYFRLHDAMLDMTVCNRSNDIIWGLYGANAVHFSLLMEYIASQLMVHIGTMYTLSNNFHGYIPLYYKMMVGTSERAPKYTSMPLVSNRDKFMADVMAWQYGEGDYVYHNDWFNQVAIPVTRIFLADKAKQNCIVSLDDIMDEGWRLGMMEWVNGK